MEPFDQSIPSELRETERRLRAERVTLDGFELDRLRRTIAARAARGGSPRTSFLRSRMSIATMLTVGLLMSMSGAGLALNGASGDGSASTAQYQSETADNHTLCADAAGAQAAQSEDDTAICSHSTQLSEQGATTSTAAMAPSTAAKTPTTSHAPAEAHEETTPVVSAAEQVAAVDQPQDSGDSLPYTGYPALIVLIGGLLILSLGLVLRRQTRRDSGI